MAIYKHSSVLPKQMIFLMLTSLVLAAVSGGALAADSDNAFTFSNSGITVSGSGDGYEIDGTALTITESGIYSLTGACSDGSITVKKEVTDVTLILNGLTLESTTTAPLSCNKSTEVTVTVTGTNTLTDSEDPADEDVTDTFEGACIKAKSGSSLTINGSGTLNLNGDCKNGIKGAATSNVTIAGAAVNISSANNALASDGSVVITSGTVVIDSEADGIKAEPEDDDTESAGTITISGGSITIDSVGDGIQATGAVNISGGTFNITTGGGYTAAISDDDSAKGIKSDTSLLISGGSFTLNCADDAVHSNGNVTLTGGTYSIRSADDGVHSDYALTLGTKGACSGPAVTITSCVEGLEGAAVTLYSGSGSITSSDDGINAANSDLATSYAFDISIYGGDWYVNAGGDGLDSNRTVNIYGGTTEVFGAANDGNSALDFENSCTYGGGTLLAVGMSGMAQAPSTGVSVTFGSGGMTGGGQQTPGGQQPGQHTGMFGVFSALTGTSSTNSAATTSTVSIANGSTIVIKDSSGNTLYSATGVKSANSVVFCSESLTSGSSYTLYVNGTAVATATASTGTGGTGTPGTTPQTPTGNTSSPFSDVASGDWFYDAVSYVRSNNLMNGVTTTTFEPYTGLTRAMLVTILYRLEASPSTGSSSFSDVDSGQWYTSAVSWAAANGIVTGYSNGSFGPLDTVTREQMAAILYRYAVYKQYDVSASASILGYSDSEQISDYALDAMEWACGAGLITGYGTSLTPCSGATRAQAATIIMRFVENVAS